MTKDDDPQPDPDVDPEAFLRALLHISPEDAERARRDAAIRAPRPDGPSDDR